MNGYKIFRSVTALDGNEFRGGTSIVVLEDYGDKCLAMVATQAPDTRGGMYEFRTEELKEAFP